MHNQTSLSRRAFLAMAGAAPFAASAFAQSRNVPIGIELYSVRGELKQDLEGTVRSVAKMGYQVVEFYSPYFSWTPERAKEIRKLMDEVGVKCLSTHNGAQAISAEGMPKAIELNRIIGSKYIVIASPPKVAGAEGWKGFADQLTAAADKLRSEGMATGFHNHQLEWRPLPDGKRPMDILAANTPKDVVLQLDAGTCVEAGADPVAWIKANPGRIKSIHLKDWAKDGRGYAVAFGEGDVPWKGIFQAAESGGGVEYYLIEQEHAGADGELAMVQRCLNNYVRLPASPSGLAGSRSPAAGRSISVPASPPSPAPPPSA
jgi:sugar phosphate isomerase/epimerase